jgi:iron complex transport system substrate-binding protein
MMTQPVPSPYSSRIVCLAAEAPEILARLGVFERIVAVSGFARRPAGVRQLPKVGGFTTPDIQKILSLEPDFAITTSDLQAEAAAALIKAGVPVLALNPQRLMDLTRNILLIGGALGVPAAAQQVAAEIQAELESLRADPPPERRPRVYFEEWPDPMICGIGWVSDLIEWVGGEDIFRDRADQSAAKTRIIEPSLVVERQPDLIIASWCGKKANLEQIRIRPGWASIPAVANDYIYELPSDQILQTGPSLLAGAQALHQWILEANISERKES